MKTSIHTITLTDSTLRLDRQISDLLPEFSRSRIQQLMATGQVQLVDGTPLTDNAAHLPEETVVVVHVPPVASTELVGEDIALDIVYEDNDVIVLNKAVGMTVHPAPGHATGTLVHALIGHCGASLSGIGGVARPGIVHRIDKDTTGLMVVAKNDAAHQILSEQLAARTLTRRYLGLVWGVPNPREGTINAPLARHSHKRQEMAVASAGKPAITHYRTLETYGGGIASLVECRLQTGRTHQIRVHMKHIGHAMIGDPVYGRRNLPHGMPEDVAMIVGGFSRQALHAYKLEFLHPVIGKRLRSEIPLPADMLALRAALKSLGA